MVENRLQRGPDGDRRHPSVLPGFLTDVVGFLLLIPGGARSG